MSFEHTLSENIGISGTQVIAKFDNWAQCYIVAQAMSVMYPTMTFTCRNAVTDARIIYEGGRNTSLPQGAQKDLTIPARDGIDKCPCGCKYWENDRCIDCNTTIEQARQFAREATIEQV